MAEPESVTTPHGDPLVPHSTPESAPAAGEIPVPHATPSAPVHESGLKALLKPSLLVTALLIVIFDQATKAMIASSIPMYESVTLIEGFLDFTHVRNSGAAFGMFNNMDLPMKGFLIVLMAFVAIIAIAAYGATLRADENIARAGLSLVLGGAVGNLIDRARQGYVLDFVDVYSGNWHFWAFNVADAAISIGAILVIFDLLGLRRNASNPV